VSESKRHRGKTPCDILKFVARDVLQFDEVETMGIINERFDVVLNGSAPDCVILRERDDLIRFVLEGRESSDETIRAICNKLRLSTEFSRQDKKKAIAKTKRQDKQFLIGLGLSDPKEISQPKPKPERMRDGLLFRSKKRSQMLRLVDVSNASELEAFYETDPHYGGREAGYSKLGKELGFQELVIENPKK